MAPNIDECIQLEENVFVTDTYSDSFRKSFGENAAEFLADLHAKYVPDRLVIKGPGPDLLVVYTYRINAEDKEILTQRAPFCIGEDGAAYLVVWETEGRT
ncbi:MULTISPECIES: hypothetical protein [Bacillus]|uniref:DUF4440 domain-containing protein n=1 Tax=Bacillus sp. BS1807G30 TaxID=3153756 RepID=A0AAU7FMH7_9BACI